jgi:hypothetical protein
LHEVAELVVRSRAFLVDTLQRPRKYLGYQDAMLTQEHVGIPVEDRLNGGRSRLERAGVNGELLSGFNHKGVGTSCTSYYGSAGS